MGHRVAIRTAFWPMPGQAPDARLKSSANRIIAMRMSALKRTLAGIGVCLMLAISSVAAGAQEPQAAAVLHPFEGTYELEPGHRISMGVMAEMGNAMAWLDLKSRKVGLLDAVSDGVFKDHNDQSTMFEFIPAADDTYRALRIRSAGTVKLATRVYPHVREAVMFRSGNRDLHGDLYLPDASGPHPVVVFAHGSGPATRGVGPFTTFFRQKGIGVLTFDKQGAGQSQGDWETASFDDLTADVLAAVVYAKSRPEVDGLRIGVHGSSQGGWIGAMAAARSSDIAFLMVRVGPGQSVRDTMAREKRGQLMVEGVTDSRDLDSAIAMYNAYWEVAARGGTWEQGNAHFIANRDAPWFKKAFGTPTTTRTPEIERWWTWLGRNLGYDSYDALQSVTVPVLWVLAEKDWNLDSQASAPRIREALELAGNTDVTVRVLPDAGHTGLLVKTGLSNEPISWQYAPGYWDGMDAWLTAHGIGR